MPPTRHRAKHDEAYKLLFSHPDLLLGLLDRSVPGLTDLIDPSSLRRIHPSFVKPEGLQQRHSDTVWRMRLRSPERHPLIVPLEFQSAPHDRMAFRIHEYTSLLLREAEIQQDWGVDGRPPIIAPVIVYNGLARWSAAIDLADWIAPNASPPLERILGLQMRRLYILSDMKKLEPVPLASPPGNWYSVLVEWERARWAADANRLVRLWRIVLESGDAGILRGFGALRQQIVPGLPNPHPDLMTATPHGRRTTMIRHEETYMAHQIRKAKEALQLEARREGRRSLLRRIAVRKFGPGVVPELSRVLGETPDTSRIEALGEAVIECRTQAEFLARAREA